MGSGRLYSHDRIMGKNDYFYHRFPVTVTPVKVKSGLRMEMFFSRHNGFIFKAQHINSERIDSWTGLREKKKPEPENVSSCGPLPQEHDIGKANVHSLVTFKNINQGSLR